MKSCKYAMAAVLIFASLMPAAKAQTGEIYVLYSALNSESFSRVGTNNGDVPHALGMRVGGAWMPGAGVALLGELGRQGIESQGSGFHVITLMAGPQLSTREQFRTRLSGELLFGAAQLSDSPAGGTKTQRWTRAGSIGGGLEIRVAERWVLQPLGLDLMIVGGENSPVMALRFNAGVKYRIGDSSWR